MSTTSASSSSNSPGSPLAQSSFREADEDTEESEITGDESEHHDQVSETSSSFSQPAPKRTYKKMGGWTKQFELPSRFSGAVERGLKEKKLNEYQKNELNRDICIQIYAFTSNPSVTEREHVAKMIVQTYPFLGDQSTVPGSCPWSYWCGKIFNRMKKMQDPNRLKRKATDGPTEDAPKKKRQRSEPWAQIPELPEGETIESLQQYAASTKSEVMKGNLKGQIDFMEKTYPLRRQDILSSQREVREVANMYPPLQKFHHLKAEMCRIFEDNLLPQNLRAKFGTLREKVLRFGASSSNKGIVKLMENMEKTIEDGTGSETEEMKDRTAFLIINMALQQKGGKKRGPQEVFTILKRDCDIDVNIKEIIQPQIVIVGGACDSDLIHIVVEKFILVTLPSHSIIDAILALLSTYYVFNIGYAHCKAILGFFEETLLGLPRSKKSLLTITSFLSDLS